MRLSGRARVGLRRRHRYIVCDGRRRANLEGACDLRVLGAEVVHRYDYFERETVLQYESEVREWGMCATAPEGGGGRNAGIVRERGVGGHLHLSLGLNRRPGRRKPCAAADMCRSSSETNGGD